MTEQTEQILDEMSEYENLCRVAQPSAALVWALASMLGNELECDANRLIEELDAWYNDVYTTLVDKDLRDNDNNICEVVDIERLTVEDVDSYYDTWGSSAVVEPEDVYEE